MFSIIIPTYNEEILLPLLLKDISEQTLAPHEVIVADAYSSDRTRAIATGSGARVVDGGLPSFGRNAGAAISQTPILIFFDADVRLPSDTYLADTIAEFEERSLDIATCDIKPTDDKKINHLFYKAYNQYTRLTERVKPHAPGYCIFIRRHIHNTIDGFDEEVRLAEDMDYVQRAAHYGSFGVLRCAPIISSTRRFDKDGHLKTAAKFIACELHMSTLGSVKHDLFNYRFGYGNYAEPSQRLNKLKKHKDNIKRHIQNLSPFDPDKEL